MRSTPRSCTQANAFLVTSPKNLLKCTDFRSIGGSTRRVVLILNTNEWAVVQLINLHTNYNIIATCNPYHEILGTL